MNGRAEEPGMEKRLDAESKELVRLIRRAEAGDTEALASIRKIADTKLPRLWEAYGNVAERAKQAIVRVSHGENALAWEATERILDQRRKELEGANPTPMEKMLVERILLCWLHVNYLDTQFAQGLGSSTWTAAEYQQKWQDRAHRRFLTAVRTLAAVRRLALPSPRVGVREELGQRCEFLELEEQAVSETGE